MCRKHNKWQTATKPDDVCSLFKYPASKATKSALNIIKTICTDGVIYDDKDIIITGMNSAALHYYCTLLLASHCWVRPSAMHSRFFLRPPPLVSFPGVAWHLNSSLCHSYRPSPCKGRRCLRPPPCQRNQSQFVFPVMTSQLFTLAL